MIIIEERHDKPDRSVAVNGWIFDKEFKCKDCGTRYQLERTDKETTISRNVNIEFACLGIRPLYRRILRNTYQLNPDKGEVRHCFAHCPICWENNLISKDF